LLGESSFSDPSLDLIQVFPFCLSSDRVDVPRTHSLSLYKVIKSPLARRDLSCQFFASRISHRAFPKRIFTIFQRHQRRFLFLFWKECTEYVPFILEVIVCASVFRKLRTTLSVLLTSNFSDLIRHFSPCVTNNAILDFDSNHVKKSARVKSLC